MPYPAELTTERLVLRLRQVDDAATYREIWTERDVRTPPHRRIDAQGRPTVQDVADRIAADGQDTAHIFWGVHRRDGDETLLGYCGLLFDGHGSPEEPELAYELLRRHHGQGYGTEAARAVVEAAAAQGCRRVVATIRDWNLASLNVVRKLGFGQVGEAEPDPEFGDMLMLARLLPART